MRAALIILLVSGFHLVYGQIDLDKTNTELEERLARLKNQSDASLSEEFSVAIAKIMVERDSLKREAQLLETKLLLLEGKLKRADHTLEAANSRINRLKLDSSTSSSQTTVKWQGYYVVLSSERSLDHAEQMKEYLMSANPELELSIIMNHTKTWYHVCVNQSYDKGQIGAEVKRHRLMGFRDAWWLGVHTN